MTLLIHILAAITGIISSTARNVIFLRRKALNPALQRIVWASTVLLFVSGFGLLLGKPALLHDPAFILKMFFVGMLFVAEVYLVWEPTIWASVASLFTWYFSLFASELGKLPTGAFGVPVIYFAIIIFSFLLAQRHGYT